MSANEEKNAVMTIHHDRTSRSTNNIEAPQQAACRIHTPTDRTVR